MDVSLTIRCATFWDAMMLRDMLEEQGVRVHWPDGGGVVLSMVASGDPDRIIAAAAQLRREFPRSGRVIVGDTDHADDPGRDEGADHDMGADDANPDDADHDAAGYDEGADDGAYLAADLDRDDI